ncbi:MAG: DUF6430 domain-containing protein [Chthoniobacteraceae bacterium]|nr:DUF6430 domain-containing protein [Chthoniobacteraceae bacterium]
MLAQLAKQPVFGILVFFGCLFIFGGVYKVDDYSKLAFSPYPKPILLSIAIGVIMVGLGVLLYVAANLSIGSFPFSKVKKLGNGYSTSHGTLVLNVLVGQIQEFDCAGSDCMVALPANEFFDDDCIHDPRSALGAYVMHHFHNCAAEIQSLVKTKLRDESSENVPKETGVIVPSYGVGKSVYLGSPLSSPARIAMVSVTTKRAGIGLHAEARYIFDAIAAVHRTMADQRLSTLFIPLIGSGHGGLKAETSLLCMLISFAELHHSPLGQNLKNVNIVVYSKSPTSEPSISLRNIKRALAYTEQFFKT